MAEKQELEDSVKQGNEETTVKVCSPLYNRHTLFVACVVFLMLFTPVTQNELLENKPTGFLCSILENRQRICM